MHHARAADPPTTTPSVPSVKDSRAWPPTSCASSCKPTPTPPREKTPPLLLARALLAVPDAPAALALLNDEFPPAGKPDAAAAFWRGQALAALSHWVDALESYAAAGPQPPARYGQAESLLALGRGTEAAAVFRDLRDDPQLGESARLRFARIALDTGHLTEAAAVLDDAPARSAGRRRRGTPVASGQGTRLSARPLAPRATPAGAGRAGVHRRAGQPRGLERTAAGGLLLGLDAGVSRPEQPRNRPGRARKPDRPLPRQSVP